MQLLDCLRGLEYAITLGWFNYKTFNLAEYEHYEKIENGDLNWIIPNKFVAFSSPSDKPVDKYNVPPIPRRTAPLLPTTTSPSSKN
jgi:cell division cycle 14